MLILARHGETNKAADDSEAANRARTLTEKGRGKLIRLRSKLADRLDAVVFAMASSMPRTHESAAILLPNLHEPLIELPVLFGHPDPAKQVLIDAGWKKLGNVPLENYMKHECWTSLVELGMLGLDAITQACGLHGFYPFGGDDVAVVGHGLYLPAALYDMPSPVIRTFAGALAINEGEAVLVHNWKHIEHVVLD
jgi:hypothetical protein